MQINKMYTETAQSLLKHGRPTAGTFRTLRFPDFMSVASTMADSSFELLLKEFAVHVLF